MKQLNLITAMILFVVLSVNANVSTKIVDSSKLNFERVTMQEQLAKTVSCSIDGSNLSSLNSKNLAVAELQDKYTDTNSRGFFDQYQRNYKGDPNVIKEKQARAQVEKVEETLEQKRERILRELDKLERDNKRDLRDYERLQEKKEEVRYKIDETEAANRRTKRRQARYADDDYYDYRY